jgi:hypothetical protein
MPPEEAVPWWQRPAFWAIVIAVGFVVLNVVFW